MISKSRVPRGRASGWFVAGALLGLASWSQAQEPAPQAVVTAIKPADLANALQAPQVPDPPPPAADPGRPIDAASRYPWLKDLPYRQIPPLGNPVVLPTGPGYYSALDWLTGNYRQEPPKTPFPPYALMRNSLYDADYRYLDDPDHVSEDFFDRFHNVHLGDDWLFNAGGQADWRHMHQYDARFSGKTDDFDLLRARGYVDFWYQDIFRVYLEGSTATTVNQDLPPLNTDQTNVDFLNAFIGIKVAEFDGNGAFLRMGRQELLLGSERLTTPLEWGNTRETFQGVHGLWSNGTYDVDLFWLQPVIPNNTGFSSIDHRQDYYGAWFTYHPNKTDLLDLYWLFLDDSDKSTTIGITQDPTSVHTLGTRYTRYTQDKNGVLWDVEPMLQLGQRGNQSILAGNLSAGLGYYWKTAPMTPTFWTYYDCATGSEKPGSGNYGTFNQLYGFGHYYLGFMDLIGRDNIRDWNTQVYLYPTPWFNINVQYHVLALDTARDALYNPSGAPVRISANGSAGGDVGQELAIICNFHLGNHSDILVGWSKLYAGEFIQKTAANAAGRVSPEMFYLMYNVRW